MTAKDNPSQEIPKSEIIDLTIQRFYEAGAIRAAVELQLWEKVASGEDTVMKIVSKEGWDQAVIKQTTTWHDFRRSFAGNLLDGGADLVTVQKLMRHSSPTTTANYDRRGVEVQRKAVKTLHVPYKGRK